MTIQDTIAITCVIAAGAFLFYRTIAQPILLSRRGKACGSGCGKCGMADAQAKGLGTAEPLVSIGTLGRTPVKRSG